MSTIKPYTIQFNDESLADLKQRITNTRWPEAETVEDWSQGAPLSYIKELAEYWTNEYDWRKHETSLNRFDHFTTEIQGLNIHFIHQRSPHKNALPLIMTHGWPGSIEEFNKVIEPLTNPTEYGGKAEDAFHVVCPSLPGYGFSGKPDSTGWGVDKIALAWDELMVTLGYNAYVAQGGDWGSIVTTAIGKNERHCKAIHINMPLVNPTPEALENPSEEDKHALARWQFYQDLDSGYSTQQATRPQTLGYGLTDSPIGQLAWIIEKFFYWMDCNGHPENIVTKDELLTNVMIYWLTKSATSSARLYWESFASVMADVDKVSLPTGIAAFPKEILPAPRSWCEQKFNIVHWTKMPKGGHFAAFEQPELFINDVRKFFAMMR